MNRTAPENLLETADHVSQAKLKRLKKLGHNFLENGGSGSNLFDTNGKRYIDCVCGGGTHNLGRGNRALAAALLDAVKETDQGNFPMISIEKARLAEKLARFAPGDLECTVYSVMRGEAIDFACKLARGFTGRRELITLKGSWFGQTGFALSLSDRKDKDIYGPLIPGIETIPPNDITAAEKAITGKTAAVFLEPVQGENNCIAMDKEYLKTLQQICRRHKTILVFDETQTGLGRCGAPFACEKSGVTPDVLVIGEALGAGIFPIAATLFTRNLNTFMNKHPMIHLSTFGGADQGCSVALKALEEYERMKPWRNAALQGKRLLNGLRALQEKYPRFIQSVTGTGLLTAIALPNEDKADNFCLTLAKEGVIALPGEVARNTVVLRPSLLITPPEIDAILQAVESACF